ncbi:MAG: hypothetical protein ACRD68_00025 [Pyrinomonadaceae bacterium]
MDKDSKPPEPPSLGEIFAKLYPNAPTPSEERILLTGYAVGYAAKAEDDTKRERARVRNLLRYVSHTGCARNALGGAQVECTCGLSEALAGLEVKG